MFKRILIPLDGSSRAERAIPTAVRIANTSHSSVILLRVISRPIEYGAYIDLPPFAFRYVLDADRLVTDQYMNTIAASPHLARITTQVEIVSGIPSQIIPAAVHSQQADLVVMCSHGEIGFKRWMVGSVAEEVIHHAPVPVLVLHQEGSDLTRPHGSAPRPLRALVALDGSTEALISLQPAAELVATLSAPAHGTLHLMQIVQPSPAADKESTEKQEHILYEAQKHLRSIAADFYSSLGEQLHLNVTWSVVVSKHVPEALIRAAESGKDEEGKRVCGTCDLITLATRPRSDDERWIYGSVTDRVLGYTRLPLLVVRRHGQQTSDMSKQAQTVEALPETIEVQ